MGNARDDRLTTLVSSSCDGTHECSHAFLDAELADGSSAVDDLFVGCEQQLRVTCSCDLGECVDAFSATATPGEHSVYLYCASDAGGSWDGLAFEGTAYGAVQTAPSAGGAGFQVAGSASQGGEDVDGEYRCVVGHLYGGRPVFRRIGSGSPMMLYWMMAGWSIGRTTAGEHLLYANWDTNAAFPDASESGAWASQVEGHVGVRVRNLEVRRRLPPPPLRGAAPPPAPRPPASAGTPADPFPLGDRRE